ncbi:arsenate reductase/protein-tyrosine-phosphatase family protein [Streptomyces chattanoogensis]|uniref:arsenate reductase/protein-tyrosine-phosphatase family protein n=1 Tax=Streptomyces chattanoogensis TaxID=66876 RepID=UPI0036B6C824
MGWLAFGYFVSYIPYAMLVKALSSGVLPGTHGPVGGLVLLPAAAMGQLVAMPVFLAASGWWRYAGRRELMERQLPFPGRDAAVSGLFAALIIGTTTLNYTFAGVSILLMLLLMRGGVLIIAPVMDTLRRRHVRASAWVAVAFSLVAVGVGLGDVTGYRMTFGAVLSLAVYLAGYVGRFEVMSRVAKTGTVATDRRYFVEEHAAAPAWQLLLLVLGAALGQPQLREGFTTFLTTPTALGAAAIGVAYEALFVFGTLIYLDRREYSWCVPANRCASLLSGLVASYALVWLAGLAAPGSAQLVALVFALCAVLALSSPALAARRRCRLLFICGGNTSRSAMAESMARAELAVLTPRTRVRPLRVASAGLEVKRPGATMSDGARAALAGLDIPRAAYRRHRARPVTPVLCRGSAVVYCMTRAQCDQVAALVPGLDGRVVCLDPAGDIPNPAGRPPEEYRACARRIQASVHARLREHLGPAGAVPGSRRAAG